MAISLGIFPTFSDNPIYSRFTHHFSIALPTISPGQGTHYGHRLWTSRASTMAIATAAAVAEQAIRAFVEIRLAEEPWQPYTVFPIGGKRFTMPTVMAIYQL